MRTNCLVLTLLAALSAGAAAAAHADEEEDKPGATSFSSDAKRKFGEGNERYARGDYDGAIESFKAAIAIDPKLPGPYRNLGLAYRALNRCTDALPMYEKYLELKPESRFTERIRRDIDLCRAKLGMQPGPSHSSGSTGAHAVEGQGWLHVAVNMMGAEATEEASVRVDGVLRGPTPLTIPVVAGTHRVHLEHPGFESADAIVDVTANERREVELTMNKLPEQAKPVVEEGETNPQPKGSYRKYAWALFGVAAGFGALGAGLGIAESQVHADAVSAPHPTTTREAVNHDRDVAANYAVGAYIGLSLGAAALIASTILFIVDPSRGETHAAQKYVLTPMVHPGGAGIAAAIQF